MVNSKTKVINILNLVIPSTISKMLWTMTRETPLTLTPMGYDQTHDTISDSVLDEKKVQNFGASPLKGRFSYPSSIR